MNNSTFLFRLVKSKPVSVSVVSAASSLVSNSNFQ